LHSTHEILEDVIKEIVPGPEERAKIARIAEKIRLKVSEAYRQAGFEADARIDGSVAKDTWLSRETDVDIFVRLPSHLTREDLETECLEVARKAFPKHLERFAEHPYIEVEVERVKVNIVPCFNVEKGRWKSATDRTPFHTEYMKAHLDDRLRKEVRLTKKFARGIGVYGAEIKVRGFSGMLCETLTLYHGSFLELLKTATAWKSGQLIDVEKFYAGIEKEIPDLFPEPLVVVDPVDKGRNVAAAVAEERMWFFVAAARRFLQHPAKHFFKPVPLRPLTAKQIRDRFAKRGSDTVFLQFGGIDAVVDVLWSQLYKTERSLCNLLKANDFRVTRSASWSDEETFNVIVLELERARLSSVRSRFGPPVSREAESRSFLEKHLGARETASGPRIEGDRWVVERTRRYTEAATLIRESLRDGGKSIGVANRISPVLRKNFKVLLNEEIESSCRNRRGLALFLTEYLRGRPSWLE